MIPQMTEHPDDDGIDCIMPALDAILAMATDEWGPHRVISMLRDKALLIETISNRRMH